MILKAFHSNIENRLWISLRVCFINNNVFHYSFGLSEEKSKHGFQQSCNIKEYYKSRFEYDIQYPHLPCFCVNGKDIIIPIEVSLMV